MGAMDGPLASFGCESQFGRAYLQGGGGGVAECVAVAAALTAVLEEYRGPAAEPLPTTFECVGGSVSFLLAVCVPSFHGYFPCFVLGSFPGFVLGYFPDFVSVRAFVGQAELWRVRLLHHCTRGAM
jgi:hypothetical protein